MHILWKIGLFSFRIDIYYIWLFRENFFKQKMLKIFIYIFFALSVSQRIC